MIPADAATAHGEMLAALRAMLEATLSPEEVAEGERLAARWLSRK